MKDKELHYISKRIYLGESDIEVHGPGEYVDNESNDGLPHIGFEFWVDDISRYKKAVILRIWYEFLGTPEKGAFFLYNAFVNEIAISRKKEDQDKDYRWEYEVCATSEMLPFVRKTIKRQLKDAGLDNHFSCRINFMQAYVRKLQDEKHYVLSVKDMTRSSAEHYLPEVFAHTMLDLKSDDYSQMLEGAQKVIVCEVSPEGTAYDVFKRMKYVIDTLESKSRDVIYYIEAGDPIKAMIFNPDLSVLMNHMNERYNVIKCIWGSNLEEAKRYTKAVVAVLIKE